MDYKTEKANTKLTTENKLLFLEGLDEFVEDYQECMGDPEILWKAIIDHANKKVVETKNIDTNKLYLAYVTSGREKYEYTTEIVGLYQSKKKAMRELFDHLLNTDRFLDLFDEWIDEDGKKVENSKVYFQRYIDQKFDTDLELLGFEQMVIHFSNSHHKDGWDYTVVEQNIC